eukprot:2950659-Rhodomonas_salina.2
MSSRLRRRLLLPDADGRPLPLGGEDDLNLSGSRQDVAVNIAERECIPGQTIHIQTARTLPARKPCAQELG